MLQNITYLFYSILQQLSQMSFTQNSHLLIKFWNISISVSHLVSRNFNIVPTRNNPFLQLYPQLNL
jgi:hypothetical protein